ncbi:MAG: hypothetical protein Q8K34_12075 [Hydrogenophaga sp.]|nr:hypothetical protein [Hydrogenophaga sp.]
MGVVLFILNRRYGAPRIMQTGFVLLLGHVAIALSGLEFLHFVSALVLLGVGWNFAFVGGAVVPFLVLALLASVRTELKTMRLREAL